jgi:hypothetical protein
MVSVLVLGQIEAEGITLREINKRERIVSKTSDF